MIHPSPPPLPFVRDARHALAVSLASLIWTLVASVAACVIGVISNSLALIAFGGVGMLDGAGSMALVIRFRHTVRHDAPSARHEGIALNIVTVGLFVIGVLTAGESVHRLVVREPTTGVTAGVVVAGAGSLVLALLAAAKRRIAARVGSHALHADSWVSAVGSALAVVTLLGTALSQVSSWTWVDPAAALLVAVGAILLSARLRVKPAA
jgi:divalent metal cation (Fe/Co/Zn/Cd) transporter